MTDFFRDNFAGKAGTPEGSSPEVGFIADQVWTVDPGKEGMLAYKDAGVAWDVTPPNPVDTINPVTMTYGVLGNVSDVSHLPRRYTVNFVWHTPPIEVMVDPYSRNLFRIEVNGLKRSDGETGSILFLAVDKRAEDGAVIMTVGRDGLWTQSTMLEDFRSNEIFTGSMQVVEDDGSPHVLAQFVNKTIIATYPDEVDIRQVRVNVSYGSLVRSVRLSGEFRGPSSGVIPPNRQIKAMNPAHIIFETLTNREWGRGHPRAALNIPSFEAAAQTLYNEGFGMCIKWARKDSIESFVQSVLDHINGALYTDRSTALLTLKLIRQDYVKSTLPLYTTDNGILEIRESTTGSGAIAVNEVIVNYHDPVFDEDRSVRVHNLAGIQAAGGAVNSVTKSYPGVPTGDLARRVAQRDLRSLSTTLRRFTILMDRRGWNIAPGDPLRIRDVARMIPDMVLRVGRVEDGTLLNGAVMITAVQDVFSMPDASFIDEEQPSWNPPNFVPCVGRHEVFEVPYFMLNRRMSQADFALLTDDSAFIGAAVERGQPMNNGYAIAVRDSEPTAEDWPGDGTAYCGYVPPGPGPGPGPGDGNHLRLLTGGGNYPAFDVEVVTTYPVVINGTRYESEEHLSLVGSARLKFAVADFEPEQSNMLFLFGLFDANGDPLPIEQQPSAISGLPEGATFQPASALIGMGFETSPPGLGLLIFPEEVRMDEEDFTLTATNPETSEVHLFNVTLEANELALAVRPHMIDTETAGQQQMFVNGSPMPLILEGEDAATPQVNIEGAVHFDVKTSIDGLMQLMHFTMVLLVDGYQARNEPGNVNMSAEYDPPDGAEDDAVVYEFQWWPFWGPTEHRGGVGYGVSMVQLGVFFGDTYDQNFTMSIKDNLGRDWVTPITSGRITGEIFTGD